MVELELVGIHSDGEHLIVMAPDGERYRLVIDEALRAAVRRDRPHLEKVRSSGAMRPRDIQVQIRAGASAEEVADASGLPIETVRRYEGPVLAEREHVSMRAQALPIGRDPDAPVLGDVVLDRLATRGVDTGQVAWDARRNGQEPWQVVVRFSSGEKLREATWEVDLTARMTRAVDDEARWLSETELESPAGRRHLQSVRSTPVYDQAEEDSDTDDGAGLAESLQAVDAGLERDARTDQPADDDDEATAALLAELSASRGVRPGAVAEDDGVHLPAHGLDERLERLELLPLHVRESRARQKAGLAVCEDNGVPVVVDRPAELRERFDDGLDGVVEALDRLRHALAERAQDPTDDGEQDLHLVGEALVE